MQSDPQLDPCSAADDADARQQIHRLIRSVLAVERAVEERKPASALAELQSSSPAFYFRGIHRRLAQRREAIKPIRKALVGQVLEEVGLLAAPPARWFLAKPVFDPAIAGGARRLAGACVQLREGDAQVRRAQMLAARSWGIGYRFTDVAANGALATALVRHAVALVAEGLSGVDRVERQGCGCLRAYHLDLGRRYERLVLDILNEHITLATPAALDADLLEKTDLWLSRPELLARRARVQVSIVHHAAYLEQKLARIARPEELVVLTPRSLASAVEGSRWEAPLLSAPELASLRCGSLAHGSQSVHRLAVCLKERFLHALARPTSHPLGPMAEVPAVVRRLMQEFAAREARRSLAATRARLNASQSSVPGKGCGMPGWLPSQVAAAA